MLRVNPTDFIVKTQIGSGYFGEVHVSLNFDTSTYFLVKTPGV